METLNIPQWLWGWLISIGVIVGLYLSNVMYDYGVPQYISRKLGHGAGGIGYLMLALFYREGWFPLFISILFTFMLALARVFSPSLFRGVGGSGRTHAMAEVWFPLAGTISIAIGWLWIGDKWLAIVPILFMAWGDMVTGLVRARVYQKEVKGWWGSAAMIVVCLMVSLLYSPYWIALAGAVVATLSERFTPPSSGWWDDNWTIIISSLLVMGGLSLLN